MWGSGSAWASMLDPFLIKLNCKQSHSPIPSSLFPVPNTQFPVFCSLFPSSFWHAAEVSHTTLHRDTGQTHAHSHTSLDPRQPGSGPRQLSQLKVVCTYVSPDIPAVSLPLRLLSCQSLSPRIQNSVLAAAVRPPPVQLHLGLWQNAICICKDVCRVLQGDRRQDDRRVLILNWLWNYDERFI